MQTPNNLPQQLTSFVGREREMRDLKRLLSTARLVTLTGAGGTGKTRLALELGSDLAEQFLDGVWLVELASFSDPALVPQAVAGLLGVREEPGRTITESLHTYLETRNILLILDNCEHLVGASASLANELLRACRDLRIVATSRQVLAIPGEIVWRVPPLSLPGGGNLRPEELRGFEAVTLFVERARLKRPEFTVTEANAGAVVQLCRRLDGLPLAIELAASRISVMTPQQIDARLSEPFRLLTAGSEASIPRQQTLQAVIDWSYKLLGEADRRVLRRLSVFAGSFSLEATEWVCSRGGDAYETIDLLSHLADRSLVVVDEEGEEARYRLLDTIRSYAADKLKVAGERGGVRNRHLEWYLRLAEEAEPELHGPEQGRWLARLELEHDNIRAALRWARESGQVEEGLRIAGALREFWIRRGLYTEGREWLEGMLLLACGKNGEDKSSHAGARARALLGAGLLAYLQGDQTSSRAYHQEGLALARQMADSSGIAEALRGLGHVAYMQGDYARARAAYEESLALNKESGDRGGVASSLSRLGALAYRQGDYAQAKALREESLAIFRKLGDRKGVAGSLQLLALVALQEKAFGRARMLAEEGLAIAREIGQRDQIGHLLNTLAELARLQEKYEDAKELAEEALAIFRELGNKSSTAVQLHNLGHLAHRLGEHERAAQLFREGLVISRELGNREHIAWCLAGMGGVAASTGDAQRGARLMGAAEGLLGSIGAVLEATDRAEFDRNRERALEALGEERLEELWAEGRAMVLSEGRLEGAISLALEEIRTATWPGDRAERADKAAEAQRKTAKAERVVNDLTGREAEVLTLIAEGLTDAQVAARLFVSPHTVHAHLTSIYNKLGVTTRGAAARWAIEHDLV